MSSRWCIFCLRNNDIKLCRDSESKTVNNGARLDQFLKLVCRYTTGEGKRNNYGSFCEVISSLARNVSGGDVGDGSGDNDDNEFGTCRDCCVILQDFCDFYEKMKVLEMKLEWKLRTLKSIMRSADKVPARLKNLQEIVKSSDVTRLQALRKTFVRCTYKKLKGSVPRVKLLRCPDAGHNIDSVEKKSIRRLNKLKSPINVELSSIAKSFSESASTCEKFRSSDDESEEEDGSVHDPGPSPGVVDLVPTCETSALVNERKCDLTDLEGAKEIISETARDGEAELTVSGPFVVKYFEQNEDQYDYDLPFPAETFEVDNESLDVDVEENNMNDGQQCVSNNLGTILAEIIKEDRYDGTCDQSLDSGESEYDYDYGCDDGTATVALQEFYVTSSDNPAMVEDLSQLREEMIIVKTENCSEGFFVEPDKERCDILMDEDDSPPPKIKRNLIIPSLKSLALKHILQLRYTCNVTACVSTMKSFFNIDDLRRHSNHHGNFHCNFCEVQVDYAPKLCLHEIEQHSPKRKSSRKTGYICPRCSFEACSLKVLKLHHFKSHLNLVPNRRTCGICGLSERNRASAMENAKRHYLEFHDLTGVNLERIKLCDEPNCRAYFRTEDQLKRHRLLVHNEVPDATRLTNENDLTLEFKGNSSVLGKLFVYGEKFSESYSNFKRSSARRKRSSKTVLSPSNSNQENQSN